MDLCRRAAGPCGGLSACDDRGPSARPTRANPDTPPPPTPLPPRRTVAVAAGARPAVAAATAGRLPQPCSGALLSDFDPAALPSLRNAFTMALLASDAYPATLLQHSTNAKYSAAAYTDTLRARWGALGARSMEAVDDSQDNLEAHALVVAGASDVFLAFRGTSTTEGWTSNVRIAPWKLASGAGAGGGLQVHSGFLNSFAAVYPRVGTEVAAALERTADPHAARVFISGHSLGGAHAMLAALALADSGAKIGGVWTFAAPKTGKADFVDAYMRRFGDVTFRWVNGLDIVSGGPAGADGRFGGALLGRPPLPGGAGALEGRMRTGSGLETHRRHRARSHATARRCPRCPRSCPAWPSRSGSSPPRPPCGAPSTASASRRLARCFWTARPPAAPLSPSPLRRRRPGRTASAPSGGPRSGAPL